MLTYSMENTGKSSLYEYLYKCIKNDIIKGILSAGTKLPSKRAFAKNLGVSTVTVENAYSQLMAEGYIFSKPKSGYFVAELLPAVNFIQNKTDTDYNNSAVYAPSINNDIKTTDLSDISPEINFSKKAPVYADFIGGRNLKGNFPFTVWSKLLREVMTEQSELLLTNPPPGGIMLLRQSIADHLYQFRGMKVSPEQIIVGAGTEYLYGLIIQLLGRDKIFAMENPGYKKISQVYSSNNVKCRYIPLDSNGVSMELLTKSNADILHISPSHHYPTGLVTPIARRHELLEWAYESRERYIIEDDYDCEFRMVGKPIPTLQSIDSYGKVIYMNTFTKSLASTIRISYMVLPVSLINKFYANLGFYSCTVSTFEQLTLYRFMSEGHFEKHINRMRNFYRNQRNLILNSIKSSPLNSHCTIKEQDSGLHFLMTVDTPLSEAQMLERADSLGIRIGFLSGFYYDNTDLKDGIKHNNETEHNDNIEHNAEHSDDIKHNAEHSDDIEHNNQSEHNDCIEHTLVINYSGIEPEKISHGIELLCKCVIQ